ncbi:hypothetical protein Tco_1268784 [Tanacetum coccineum]
MKIKESLNVTFDESYLPPKTSPLEDDDLVKEEAIKVSEKKPLGNDVKDESLEIDKIVNIKESKIHPLENIIGNLNQRTLMMSFGRHLEEIHMTWTQLGKKRDKIATLHEFDQETSHNAWRRPLGWHLEEIHVTWAHLEKKRTRLRLYAIYLEELCKQSMETASQTSSDGVRIFKVTVSWIWRRKQLNNEILHEKDSKSALSVIKVQFDKFIHSEMLKSSNYDSNAREARQDFKDYT